MLTTIVSASASSPLITAPDSTSWPSIFSESTRFFAQPSETNDTTGGSRRAADFGPACACGVAPITGRARPRAGGLSEETLCFASAKPITSWLQTPRKA